MDSSVECCHCRTAVDLQETKHACGDCARGPFCSQRCRFMDYEIGGHSRECRGQVPASVPFEFRFSAENFDRVKDAAFGKVQRQRVYLPYQTVPRLEAYSVEWDKEHSFFETTSVAFDQAVKSFEFAASAQIPPSAKAAMHIPVQISEVKPSSLSLLFQMPRLNNGVYVLLGEDNYESVHEAVGQRPGHRFVGGAHWTAARSQLDLVAFARGLGEVLGDIHFRQCCDASGFSVVGASTVDDERVRLFVQCDPEMTRTLNFDRVGMPDEEVVDRLAFVLGRLAYTPRPRQEQLFRAFASGYKASAARNTLDLYASAVLMRLYVYTE